MAGSIFQDQKEPHIRVRWEKVAYDAKVDYIPSLKNKRTSDVIRTSRPESVT